MSELASISLFMPFYTPKDPARAEELLYCLKQNLTCAAIDKIYLLQDDDTVLPFQDARVVVLKQESRPTYLDWVRQSRRLCPDGISILANSDIYFDDSAAKLRDIFAAEQKSFVALSRYDKQGDEHIPHPNPHWSQDTWVFAPAAEMSPAMDHQLDIPLGTPRCDNKIGYIFSLNGFSVFNPMRDIKSVHVHETDLRYYDKKGDVTIKGGMAMVHASPDLLTPAPLDIEIWSENSSKYSKPVLNKSLEKWAAERAEEQRKSLRVLGFDAEWQYPAITEQHAFRKMQELLPAEVGSDNTVYFGFPWATLIDLSTHAKHRPDRIAALKEALAGFRDVLGGYDRVITVCQHIRMCQFPDLFRDAGITDIFWSHAIKGQTQFPDAESIALHPFPLFPVQQSPVSWEHMHDDRPTLFSFVGARANHVYLTQVRNQILDVLKDHPAGKVIDRDTWHYNKVVYDKQILDRADSMQPEVDQSASEQFRKIMAETTFSLCPSGSGPNSIRLWEAGINSSIPVVLADTYQYPGDSRLWDLATVQCPENEESLRALPERLEALAANPDQMRRKRVALYLLMQKYGPERFVHDIIEMMHPAA